MLDNSASKQSLVIFSCWLLVEASVFTGCHVTVLKVTVLARQMRLERKRTVGLYHPYLPMFCK